MGEEKLDIVRTTDFLSNDRWSYTVKVYEDVTEIYITEGSESPTLIGELTSGYDIQIRKEIIRLRELKNKEIKKMKKAKKCQAWNT